MTIFAIDDEPIQLKNLHGAIAEAEPKACIRDFSLGASALDAIQNEGLRPDVVFSDIRMPGMSGLELAVRMKTLCPGTRVVFVTGYDEYALDAFRARASGYVLKPVDAAQIREELDHLPTIPVQPGKLRVQCFGYFEVFWQDRPLHFGRHQTKELLAYLISRSGTACTTEQISAALWEDEGNVTALANRVRVLLGDLRTTFKDIGMEDVIVRKRGWIAVDTRRIDCDFYRMQEGDIDALNSFTGQFMQQYSWAELTAGALHFQILA